MPMPMDIKGLIERPETENLLGIYSSLRDQKLEDAINDFNGKQFSEFKEKLSEALIEKIQPISNEIKKLLNDEKYLDEILLKGCEKADKIASKKIKEIKKLLNDEKYLDTILLEGSVKADKIASKKIKEIKELVGF